MSKQPEALYLADYVMSQVKDANDVAVPVSNELRRQHALIAELLGAVNKVLSHRHDTPTTGYLRDNDKSRDALKNLSAVAAKAETQQ